MLRNIPEEPEGLQEIGLPGRIRPDDDVERAELHLQLVEALEVGDLDLLDGHGGFVSRTLHRVGAPPRYNPSPWSSSPPTSTPTSTRWRRWWRRRGSTRGLRCSSPARARSRCAGCLKAAWSRSRR